MNKRTIERAKEVALALYPVNHSHRCFHVAFLVRKNRILHIGINSNKSHPRILEFNYKQFNIRLHAELHALIKSGRDNLSGFEMVSLRINVNKQTNQKQFTMAKPCCGCNSMLYQTNVGAVYYSDVNGEIEMYVPSKNS